MFYTIMLATAAVFALFASKIDFEEDISKLLPSAGDGGAEELVFSDLKVKDKIFIQFTAREGLAEAPGPEELIAIGDEFVANLIDGDTTYNAIGNILPYIDESLLQDGIAFLYENAPAYIDARHYKAIEALLSPDSIDSRLAENYATLRTAAGRSGRRAQRGVVLLHTTDDTVGREQRFYRLIVPGVYICRGVFVQESDPILHNAPVYVRDDVAYCVVGGVDVHTVCH